MRYSRSFSVVLLISVVGACAGFLDSAHPNHPEVKYFHEYGAPQRAPPPPGGVIIGNPYFQGAQQFHPESLFSQAYPGPPPDHLFTQPYPGPSPDNVFGQSYPVVPPPDNTFSQSYSAGPPPDNIFGQSYPVVPPPDNLFGHPYPGAAAPENLYGHAYSGAAAPENVFGGGAPQEHMFTHHYAYPTEENSFTQTYHHGGAPPSENIFDPFAPPSQSAGGLSDGHDQEKHTRISSPSDFVSKSPPKAIMTTAADLVHYRRKPFEMSIISLGAPRRVNYHYGKYSPIGNRRRPMTFHNINNKQNTHFSYNSNSNRPVGRPRKPSKSKFSSKRTKIGENEITDAEQLREYQEDYPLEPLVTSSWALTMDDELNRVAGRPHSQAYNPLPFEDELDEEPAKPESLSQAEDDFDDIMSNRIQTNKNKRAFDCPDRTDDLKDMSVAEVYPDPEQCDQFYYCKWGKAYVFKCPRNNFFNPYLKACDADSDFACAMSLRKK